MRLLITAPAGKMGRLIVREALKRPDEFSIIGALGNPARDYIGKDIGTAANCGPVGALVHGEVEEIIDACDGVVDFSTPETTMRVVDACVRHRKPLLIGTTGFSREQEAVIAHAGEVIPLSEAHNTSRAVNLIYALLRTISRTVGRDADVDILEMHDNRKQDAPSGTSKVMGRIIAEELGLDWETAARFGRAGDGSRAGGEIVYHSVRSGDIASTHTVIFGMEGERIELTHHAYDYSTFAKGALDGILYLLNQPPGMYDSNRILGIEGR